MAGLVKRTGAMAETGSAAKATCFDLVGDGVVLLALLPKLNLKSPTLSLSLSLSGWSGKVLIPDWDAALGASLALKLGDPLIDGGVTGGSSG